MKRLEDTEAGPWIVRFLRGHVRLWIAILLGIAVFLALIPTTVTFVGQLLVTWDVGIVAYLAMVTVLMARSTHKDIRYHSAMQDEGAIGLLVLSVTATVASLGAVFADLAAIDRSKPGFGMDVTLALATVVLSWTFTHTIFALHYAHEYYGTGRHARGLNFPGDEPPDYWDFVYFSFVLGMTFQVSDVAITNKGIRRLAVAHGALAFMFTVTILAVAVNIAASLVGR
jgi:uncharacterized membrane protein